VGLSPHTRAEPSPAWASRHKPAKAANLRNSRAGEDPSCSLIHIILSIITRELHADEIHVLGAVIRDKKIAIIIAFYSVLWYWRLVFTYQKDCSNYLLEFLELLLLTNLVYFSLPNN